MSHKLHEVLTLREDFAFIRGTFVPLVLRELAQPTRWSDDEARAAKEIR